MVQQVKDLAFTLLWLGPLLWQGFDPWPGNFCMSWLGMAKKKKKKKSLISGTYTALALGVMRTGIQWLWTGWFVLVSHTLW